MSNYHGFELIDERDVPEIDSHVRLFRHIRTGAQLLSVENDDENKSFGITFKTPVSDSTGVPHILEHSVLNGSRKYPVKEPFVELLKASLNTFLNAMTADDMTIYPVASTNTQDFYNLIDVYLDAVFFPLISERVLQQEGWHYEAKSGDEPLIYKGVVFNEMKAAYSAPDRLLAEYARQALLPDTPYAHDPGGHPAYIPDLTYEQFKGFHETFYHPSNAFIFFYGDDNPEQRLRLIDDFIAEFERRDVDATLPLQPRFDQPRQRVQSYDAGDATADSNKTLVTVSWLLTDVTHDEEILALRILDEILIDTPASPLRRALIESGLGEDLTGGGLDAFNREASYHVGLKGIKAADAEKVEQLILETLSELADNGVEQAMIDAALNTIEFELRERNTGRFPRGLMTLMQILPAWTHGGDPIARLAFENPLSTLKQRLNEQSDYFEELIGKYFLNNPHRSTVILVPDPEVGPKREAAEKARLEAVRQQMTDDDVKAIIEDTRILQEIQRTPDKPEDIAKIPTLHVSDLEREVKTVPTQVLTLQDATVLYHELPTSGVVYVDLTLDMHTLPQHLLPYGDLFGTALIEMGTEKESYVQLTQRIGATTGGINTGLLAATNMHDKNGIVRMVMRGKATSDRTQHLLDIMQDILLTVNLDSKDRFKQIVLEAKADQEAYIGVAGQATVAMHLGAQLDEANWAAEQMNGVSQLFFLRELAERIDNDWPAVLADLEAVRRHIINRGGIICNVTTDADNWQQFEPQLGNLLASLPSDAIQHAQWDWQPNHTHTAFTAPAQVNFVGKAANLYEMGYTHHGSQVVIFKHMNLDYMWNSVRVMGGAYGGRAMFDHSNGLLTFLSWRDPNLVDTLKVYDGAANYLKSLQLTDSELERAIIGAVGSLDTYLLPDAKGYQAMLRHMIGYTDEMRQQVRDEVLATTLTDFHKLGEVLSDFANQGLATVVTSKDRIQAVNDKTDKPFNVVTVL